LWDHDARVQVKVNFKSSEILLPISEVARQAGLRPSAIRYYERLGILAPPKRVNGRRRYEAAVIYRLAVVRRASEVGFTLEEIRQMFFSTAPVSARWRQMATAKLAELDAQMQQIKMMKQLLQQLQTKCECDTVERCGAGILKHCVLPSRDGERSD
jgi:MerR family redox-sensitive transcriptional activator SoxR